MSYGLPIARCLVGLVCGLREACLFCVYLYLGSFDMVFFKRFALTALIALVFSTKAFGGYVASGVGTVTFAENGWFGEGFAVYLSSGAAVTGCPAASTEFWLDAAHPGYKVLIPLLLTAYAQQTPVQLVVNQGDCGAGNRTKITSIRLL